MNIDTKVYYDYLYAAYDYLNNNIIEPVFGHALNRPVITLSHKATARGFYVHEIYQDKTLEQRLSEVSISRPSLRNDSLTILSTLLHEMIHKLTFELNTAAKSTLVTGYHCKNWERYMKQVGLEPVFFNGKIRTKVSHNIVEDGVFKPIAQKFINEYGEFPLAQGEPDPIKESNTKTKSRPQFYCNNCGTKFSVPKSVVDEIIVTCRNCNTVLECNNE
ncbi:MAG: hypothetical protein KDH96_04480 [Candidatus Riesia sp.]|nr:hypothetical protein [Candidatus Riesia sp.]